MFPSIFYIPEFPTSSYKLVNGGDYKYMWRRVKKDKFLESLLKENSLSFSSAELTDSLN